MCCDIASRQECQHVVHYLIRYDSTQLSKYHRHTCILYVISSKKSESFHRPGINPTVRNIPDYHTTASNDPPPSPRHLLLILLTTCRTKVSDRKLLDILILIQQQEKSHVVNSRHIYKPLTLPPSHPPNPLSPLQKICGEKVFHTTYSNPPLDPSAF